MNVILPKELLMEQNLTWQAVLFIWLGALELVMLIMWSAAKGIKAVADCYKTWAEVLKGNQPSNMELPRKNLL